MYLVINKFVKLLVSIKTVQVFILQAKSIYHTSLETV